MWICIYSAHNFVHECLVNTKSKEREKNCSPMFWFFLVGIVMQQYLYHLCPTCFHPFFSIHVSHQARRTFENGSELLFSGNVPWPIKSKKYEYKTVSTHSYFLIKMSLLKYRINVSPNFLLDFEKVHYHLHSSKCLFWYSYTFVV